MIQLASFYDAAAAEGKKDSIDMIKFFADDASFLRLNAKTIANLQHHCSRDSGQDSRGQRRGFNHVSVYPEEIAAGSFGDFSVRVK